MLAPPITYSSSVTGPRPPPTISLAKLSSLPVLSWLPLLQRPYILPVTFFFSMSFHLLVCTYYCESSSKPRPASVKYINFIQCHAPKVYVMEPIGNSRITLKYQSRSPAASCHQQVKKGNENKRSLK